MVRLSEPPRLSEMRDSPDSMESDPDVRWMMAVQRDGAAAFEKWVYRYQRRLSFLQAKLVGDREQAHDLTQAVLLRVLRARKKHQPRPSFGLGCLRSSTMSPTMPGARRFSFQLSQGESPTGATGQLSTTSGMSSSCVLDRAEEVTLVREAISSLNE